MRIGIVTTWFERGAAYVSRQYRDLLAAAGHSVFIFARGGERYAIGDPAWDVAGVTWSRRRKDILTGIHEGEFRAWIRNNGVEVVLFNEQIWLEPLRWAKEEGAASVGYVDYYTESSVDTFGLYDGLLCNTRRHLSVFKWHPAVLYLPWGTDVNLFKPGKLTARRQDGPVFFHSGGMNPYRKGTDMVLAAFTMLKGEARLVLHLQAALQRSFPHDYERLQKLIDSSPNIRLIEGEVSAPGLYHLGDVYVYPSRLDGIGLTQAEALACGLPLITPDNAPMNEFTNHEAGFTVPVEKLWCRRDAYYWPQCEVNIDALAATMQVFINKFGLLPALKQKARQYAVEKLDWSDRGAELDGWLTRLVQKRGKASGSAA